MTVVKSNELIGHHYEGDRWLRRDDDFYYLYSVDEPEIWISYIPNFDKWSNSTLYCICGTGKLTSPG
jgi:hypothetical protein